MSFDVYIMVSSCTECGGDERTMYEFNITHNVNSIVDRCLVAGGATKARTGNSGYAERSWGRLEGWTVAEVTPIVDRALDEAIDPTNRAEFLAMQPDNGWGSLDGVQRVLKEFRDQLLCARPQWVIHTSG